MPCVGPGRRTSRASKARCHQATRTPAASVSYGVTDFRSARLLRKTKAHAELRRCWRLLALALGRDDPFPAPPRGASQPAVISSFDGILCTTATDNFKGLQAHTDTYPPPHGETGQLQALAYVHPPPQGVLRLGCAVAFYPAKAHSLWRDYLLALVTRWSTSPDLDLRWSPLPGLGSKKRPRQP